MHRYKFPWLLCALAVAALGAASGSDSPTGTGDEGAYIFEPAPGSFAIDVFDSFRVRVRARDGGAVSGVFFVNGDTVGTGSEYAWWAAELGTTEIRVELPPPDDPVVASWAVTVSEGESPDPERVTQLTAGRGEVPGSINLLWERPAINYESIDFYRIYYDTSPIDVAQLSGIPVLEVDHNRGTVEQAHRLEQLEEQAEYYLRIQIVDLIGREAELSPEVSNMSTGHYRVSGRITRLIEDAGGAEGFANILIEMGEYKTLTDAQGHFDLDDIPDVLERPLSARPTEGSDPFTYYWALTDTLDTQEQTLDLLLIRRSLVRLDIPEFEEIFMLDYLYQVTAKSKVGVRDPIIWRWESYPISVRTDSEVVDPGGGDIGASLLRGIDAWNAAAGEPMFVAVSGVPAIGVDFAVISTTPGGVLGEVRMVVPSNPQCLFQCIPVQVVVQMSKNNRPGLMDLVAVHELGHVLWLTHSRNSEHVLSDGVSNDSPSLPQPDEVLAARYVKHIPNGTDLRWYQDPEF